MSICAKTRTKLVLLFCTTAVFLCGVIYIRATPEKTASTVKSASSQTIYAELLRRTTNILAAPADTLQWQSLKFDKQLSTGIFGKMWATRSVYDDSTTESPKPSQGPLATVPDSDLADELVVRTQTLTKTIYGTDRRMDLYSAIRKRDDAIRAGVASPPEAAYVKCATAVGFIVDVSLLQKLPSGDYYIAIDQYGQVKHLCSVENFWNQPCINGIGTAFLISHTELCTAYHCAPDDVDITRLRVVFDYSLLAPQIPSSIVIKSDDIYGVKRRVTGQFTKTAEDWTVLELDRACPRSPLSLGQGQPAVHSRVFAIGYPDGIPLKISPNAEVRKGVGRNGCFIAAADVNGGNSGSPVISEITHEVEGILVRGNEDFRLIKTGECMRSVVINDRHSGEEVCSVGRVKRNQNRAPKTN